MLSTIRRLWEHLIWADHRLLAALEGAPPPAEAIREYAHILGGDEVWLARLTGRSPRFAVWPEMDLSAIRSAVADMHVAWTRYLEGLDEAGLSRLVGYTNSAGQSFRNPVGEILIHVATHAHYHRGKINLLLRQSGLEPAPSDYIAWVRGVDAARGGGR